MRLRIIFLLLLILGCAAATTAQAVVIDTMRNGANYDVFSGQVVQVVSQYPVNKLGISYVTTGSSTSQPLVPFNSNPKTFSIQVPDCFTGSTTAPITLNCTIIFDKSLKLPNTTFALFVYPAPAKAALTQVTSIRSGGFETYVLSGSSLLAPAHAINVRIAHHRFDIVGVTNTQIIAQTYDPQDLITLPIGQYAPSISIWGIPVSTTGATFSTMAGVRSRARDYLVALAIAILVGVAFLAFCTRVTIVAINRNIGPLKRTQPTFMYLTYETANCTFSLSKFQFYVWMTIILIIWTFLLIYKSTMQATLTFPDLTALGEQFVISIVTLVMAQTINAMRGVKGAGEVGPHFSDLYTHGGVVAPERLLQLIWTIIGGIAFCTIALVSYPYTGQLPKIDDVLMVLMGISSTAYGAGKLVRNAGPVIDQVIVRSIADDNSQKVLIYGSNLSTTPMILVNNKEVPFDLISGLTNSTQPGVTDMITVVFDAATATSYAVSAEPSTATVVKIINSDGQYAVCKRYDPPVDSHKKAARLIDQAANDLSDGEKTTTGI